MRVATSGGSCGGGANSTTGVGPSTRAEASSPIASTSQSVLRSWPAKHDSATGKAIPLWEPTTRGALLTHVERKSLFTTISKLTRSTAAAAHRATVRRLTPLRDHVHTITYDNGKEFAGHRHTAHRLQTHIFFATPSHAWERGVNENTNGLILDFFPKGTDFTTIHPATVAKVERLLNRRPRKSLGFYTPNEVFHALTRGG